MFLTSNFNVWRRRLMCCLIFQFSAGLVCGAPPVTEEVLAQRRASIASMSESQRQLLARKYQQFQALDEAERHKLQRLHDVVQGQPDLKLIMRKYCDWLEGLDPEQREELRQAKTPEQKRNLVVRIQEEQRKARSVVLQELTSELPEIRVPAILNGDELKEVMATLEAELASQNILDQNTRTALAGTAGSQHYLLLMQAIGIYRLQDGKERDFQVPDKVKTQLIQITHQNGARPKLAELLSDGEDLKVSRFIFMVLLRSTLEDARRDFGRQDAKQFKENIFNSLPAERRAELSRAPAGKRDLMLMRAHLDEIQRAYAAAGDFKLLRLRRPQPTGDPRGTANDSPENLKVDGDRGPSNSLQERVPEGPPPGRRPKVE